MNVYNPVGVRGSVSEVAGTALVGFVAVVWLAFVAHDRVGLSAHYPVKAGACFLIVAAVALGGVGRSHPLSHFGWANRVTFARAALVALAAGAIGETPSAAIATAVVMVSLVVTALDGVDGWLARRSRLASAFGARFDMEVDALLMLVLSVLVWQHGKAGAWILLAGLLRYLFVAAGWLAPWMRQPLPASLRRKAICVVQIGGLMVAMLPAVPPPSAAFVSAITLGALVYSFLADTLWLWRSDRREQVA